MQEPFLEDRNGEVFVLSQLTPKDLAMVANGGYRYVPDENGCDEGVCRAIAAGMLRFK